MKIDLGDWWPFARTVWGWTVASIGGLAALYYAPRKMFETFDWYMDRFVDYKVADYLKSEVEISHKVYEEHYRRQTAKPHSIKEIADATRYSEKRVQRCLRRLEKKKSVARDDKGHWRAEVPWQVQL
jgi:hypothetical protein